MTLSLLHILWPWPLAPAVVKDSNNQRNDIPRKLALPNLLFTFMFNVQLDHNHFIRKRTK